MANPTAADEKGPVATPSTFGPEFCMFFAPGHGINYRECQNSARTRGGILHFVAAWAFHWQLQSFVQRDEVDWEWFDTPFLAVALFMFAEFILASFLGLGFSPIGVISIIITQKIQGQEADWRCARPKRFAWFIGYFMVAICIAAQLAVDDFVARKAILIAVAGI
jgi:hypothetical protein